MTKVYVMERCPDCREVKDKLSNNADFEIIDIGVNPKDLKAFLQLRDHSSAFAKVRERGTIGIPCFVYDSGDIYFSMKHLKLSSTPIINSCSLDGTGC